MALEDLIAQAGPQLYETMRKGWLPNQAERKATRMADLQLESKKLENEATKTKLQYLPKKRRLEEKKILNEINYKKALTEKNELDIANLKTEAEKGQYILNQKTMGQHLAAATAMKTTAKRKQYLRLHKPEFLKAGDDKEDAAFNAVLNMSGSQFNESFGLIYQGNKYIQGLTEKRFGKSTSLQNLKTGETKTVSFNDPDYQLKVDDALNSGMDIIKTPGLEMQGTPETLGLRDKKLNRELINEESAIRSANFIGKRTIDLMMKSPESLATTGAFARMASSLRSQIDSTAKMMGISWKKGTNFDPGSYSEIFQNAGIDNVVLRGNLTQLARMLATSAGEAKVLSDPDMKRWLNVVAVGNGDPKIVSAAIRNALEIQNFRFKEKYRLVKNGEYKGDLGYPKKETSPDRQELLNRQNSLREELLKMDEASGTQ